MISTGIDVIDAGLCDYVESQSMQRGLVAERRTGVRSDTLLFVVYPPTFTIGRSGSRGHILFDEAECDRQGISVIETDRGGDVTYHGPGQIVVYPIIDLRPRGGDAHAYLRCLENSIINVLFEIGVQGQSDRDHTGVWIGDAKIAAIGVKISGGITSHGAALNVATSREHWSGILACGLEGRTVTNLQEHYHGDTSFEVMKQRMVTQLTLSLDDLWPVVP